MPSREVVKRFIAVVESGRYVEAIAEFYTDAAKLALQRWEGERIAEERFYYDPGQMPR